MNIGGERSRRVVPIAAAVAAGCLALAPGCRKVVVGEPAKGAQEAGGPEIRIVGAAVDGTGHVVASLHLTNGGVPVASRAAALALQPAFTLASVSTHPVDGLAAWRSLILTGGQTLAQLPPGGPGTPAGQVLSNVRQPGAESGGTLSGKDGEFTYTYATALPAGFDPQETLRVGVWLLGNGTAEGTSTFDFRPAGGTPAPRDTVLQANCDRCHDRVVSPRGAVGVRMCVTCHTWQNADPDTVDPAALDGATAATDPNPLDLGRMVHRIHRGKNLPTLYASSSTAAAPALPSATALPLPFFPGRNAVIAGRKYSIVGPMSQEVVFGRVVTRTDNGQTPGKVVATGVVFPRDLRDCDVCHAGAPQEYEVLYAVSRRTCSGCHPEVWFAPPNADGTTSITDAVHFAHPGGPQADDTQCGGCHVVATATQPKVYAPLAELHVPPYRSARFDRPVIEIVSVEDLRPGAAPTVRFKVYDELGTISPLSAPTPLADPRPDGSPVPRGLQYFALYVGGPTAPGYSGLPLYSGDGVNPNPLAPLAPLAADANGVFTYTFVSPVPATASGTWAVGIEGRRRPASTTLYDTAPTDQFRWPYTGEAVSETPQNALAYVDTATGSYTRGAPGAAVPRRTVVAEEKCARCHDRLLIHGTVRNRVEYCVVCHAPDRTDWEVRPKVNGNVNLAATYDGIEERSIDFKVMIHRIHTGGRRGVASLEGIEPLVIYGKGGSVWFFDEGIFPNALQDCTLCHEGKTYTVEAVPADAPPTRANETPTIRHAATSAHAAGEPATPPIQAACLGCHGSGATQDHARRNTLAGVEQCASCHVRGALSVDVAHGLARPDAAVVGASYSSIAEKILVPRCASAACHGGSPPAAFPRLDAEAGYGATVGVASQQASGVNLVEPFEPGASYLVLKLRGEAGSVGGVATPMPIGDALLEPSEIAAIEAWIANGAPND